MGALDFLSDLLADFSISIRRKKRRAVQTFDIKVKIDCDGCERRIKNTVSSIKGVRSVTVNRKLGKVTVTGYMEPNKVLKEVRSIRRKAELWPYVPVNVTAYPYAAGAYDKRAPSGLVRNVPQALPSPGGTNERLSTLFSDENPNACSIM